MMSEDVLGQYWAHKEWKPSDGQRQILEAAISRGDEWDVLVVEAPTAFGKSVVAKTLLKWAHKAKKYKGALVVPNNMLVDQMTSEYGLPTLKRRDQYGCSQYKGRSCAATKSREGGYCKGCPYTRSLRMIRAVPSSVLNYHMYIAHKLKHPFVIVDEAHKALDLLGEMAGKKLWQHDVGFPDQLRTVGEIKAWLETCPGYEAGFPNDPKLKILADQLENPQPSYLIEPTEGWLRGQLQSVINLIPLDVSQAPPYLWPSMKKLVLMSATISLVDIRELGLDTKRVLYLRAPSPIGPDRRPVRVVSEVGSMSKASQEASLPRLCGFLERILERHPEKGLIHGTYSLNELMRSTQFGQTDRLMWHSSSNKRKVYEEWLASPAKEGRVLVSAGMHEGLDLKEDLCRWQVVAKCPFPSLEDTGVKFKAERNADWYAWQTIKLVCQAAGRVCRGPKDWGITYIADSSFKRLFENNNSLFPEWFKEAVMFE